MLILLGVAVAGALGAPSRFLLDRWITARSAPPFPRGTFLVNLSGSLLLGFLTGLVIFHGAGPLYSDVFGIGFCGAYTTFSTFSYETVRLIEDGDLQAAAASALGGLALGLLAAGAGLALASLG